jgi:hypothetical protein
MKSLLSQALNNPPKEEKLLQTPQFKQLMAKIGKRTGKKKIVKISKIAKKNKE